MAMLWGNMLRDGQRLLSTAWWMAVAPGVTLSLPSWRAHCLGTRCVTRSIPGRRSGGL
jgi:ABC-type dipeptide/oligopeptide/nickel transport system permease subunit